MRARATGSSDRVRPPLTPTVLALWLLVGAGYAIRGVSGLSLATDLVGEPALALAAALTTWSFGVAFVTGRWAIEALAFARRESGGSISWQVARGQAREHSLALVRWLPSRPAGSADGGRCGDLADWQALRGAHLSAPWNVAALLAASAATGLGQLLAGAADPFELLVARFAGGLLAVGPLVTAGRRLVWWVVAGVGLTAALAAIGSPRPLLAALPWAFVVGAHLLFTAQSRRTLPHPLRGATAGLGSDFMPARRRFEATPKLSRR